MKIGVRLPSRFTDAGDYLADVRALDAIGVNSLWLPDDGFDPWLMLAGIATVTGRTRLAVSVSARDDEASDGLARRMATLDRLSRGRVLTIVAPASELVGIKALIARTRRLGPGPVMLDALDVGHAMVGARLADGLVVAIEPADCHAVFDQARDRRQRDRLTAPFELWARVASPEGREHWRSMLAAAVADGTSGVIVPAGPRLLDLLRNADEEDDRSDLILAQG